MTFSNDNTIEARGNSMGMRDVTLRDDVVGAFHHHGLLLEHAVIDDACSACLLGC